ncbi:hypothetical protein TVAG_204770 [Trichomonas vaginalis G3]|uniref:Uncharacterized protein n=1 Tax=Trichomonas vaginalis (strain ATCC PRA-98 / G3) TaxID=412133 RepID=A2EIY1_TRIV3|nr:armadillo (ARM) repeat-containing protein family [Trichomonas vaginalis G3]EAY07371.1 hypothetical protein TVAG_204770 [Trichomonas vaginalis G3]KAI5506524.1 armadillo (ARM) repeat-containing protein family [Trichomonas vaginalis G3]|eukprot:XP_001319594.1 hypothetical protein [Trichomonas vaginalis G3]
MTEINNAPTSDQIDKEKVSETETNHENVSDEKTVTTEIIKVPKTKAEPLADYSLISIKYPSVNQFSLDKEVPEINLLGNQATIQTIAAKTEEKSVKLQGDTTTPATPPNASESEDAKKRRRSSNTLKIGPNVPFDDVITNPGLIRVFNTEHAGLLIYLSTRINQLIDACFHTQLNSVISSNAYLILSSQKKTIISAFLQADSFQSIGAELFIPEELDYPNVGRFTGIISGIIDNYPDKIIDKLGFLPRLVHHCYFPNVASLLFKLVKDTPQMKNVHKYLNNFGLHEMIIREMESFKHVDYKTDLEYFKSRAVYRMANLFHLISLASQVKTLEKHYKTVYFLSQCEKTFHPKEFMIDDEKWTLILSLTSDNYADNLSNFILSAVEVLKTASNEKFHQSSYFALLFLSQMLRFNKHTSELLIEFGFVPLLLKLMFKYSYNNYFVEAFRKFILLSLKYELLIKQIIQLVLPALLAFANDPREVNLTASIHYLVQVFEKNKKEYKYLGKELKNLPDYDEYLNNEYKVKLKLYDSNYGESYKGQLKDLLGE